MIQDHSDHGASKEPMNPLWGRIYRFLWCTMIRVILNHWSRSGSSQKERTLRQIPINIINQAILHEHLTLFYSLRSFPYFAVRSSSAHEGKIIIFERFHCSLTKIIQLIWELVKLIGKFETCSIQANFYKTRPRLPSENEQKTPTFAIFCTLSSKRARWPPNFFSLISLAF